MEIADLLLNTVSMSVIANVPPRGMAKAIIESMDARSFGKKPMPCNEPGMKRRPVPHPVSAIMPKMVALCSW